MRGRDLTVLPEHLYPAEAWRVTEARYSDRFLARAETVLALSNGFIGMRGSHDEGRPARSPGTLINGLHETWPIRHAEEAYGLARTGQSIVEVPDATVLQLYIDDEPLFVPSARIRQYERVLDMRNGLLTRSVLWSTPGGKHVRIISRRLASLQYRHLAAIDYEVIVLDQPAPVAICSQLINRHDLKLSDQHVAVADPRLRRSLDNRIFTCRHRAVEGLRITAGYETAVSHMRLAVGVEHVMDSAAAWTSETSQTDDFAQTTFTVDAEAGVPVRLTKYISYHISRSAPPTELSDRCVRTLTRAAAAGFEPLRTAQRQQLDNFWDRADICVETDGPEGARLQQSIRWNLFQVAQASWHAEGSGIPAKGLTGSGYDGHYFWDTETYVLPFLSYTQPRIARNLLRFRYSMLPKARERARQLELRGALFPWRTITGEEASANFVASTAQYHINADISHALVRYLGIRGDFGFAVELGAELLVETARFWEDLGFYGRDGKFHIHGVTGPDEYTTVVNDNTFTNLMARHNLRQAARTVDRMRRELPHDYAGLVADTGLEEGEVGSWDRAAAAMYVPYDQARGIHPQDDSFLQREVWDLERTPRERFPLLLHFHPLTIYRYQVLKQADIVLAMFLLGDEFSLDQKRRNFDYYDPLTTGDSSLSACVQSVIAAEVGHCDEALAYFNYALLMDLGDVAGNASDGVHIASAAGVWLCLVQGFAGMRDHGGQLSFTPALPGGWSRLRFSLRFRERQLRISLGPDEERYGLAEGAPLEIVVRGRRQMLCQDQELVLHPADDAQPAGGDAQLAGGQDGQSQAPAGRL